MAGIAALAGAGSRGGEQQAGRLLAGSLGAVRKGAGGEGHLLWWVRTEPQNQLGSKSARPASREEEGERRIPAEAARRLPSLAEGCCSE